MSQLSGGPLAPAANRTELARRFAQSIALQIELPNVFQEAIARSRELCDADGASLILVDQDTGELRFDTLSGQASTPLYQVRLRPGQGIAGKAASEAMSQLVVDVQAAPDFDSSFDSLSGFKTGSIMAVPLINSGDVVGVLVTQNQKITIRSRTTSSEQIIEVEDEGCGIPPEHLHRVFEPFFTTRVVGQGIGLGLTVAYGVVARSQGTISVHSEAGRGAKFTIALPRSKRALAKEVLRKPPTLAVSAAERSHLN